jgi:hypothetical protein
MQNEFYEVVFDYSGYGKGFFKDKDRAFEYLWQKFLNRYGDACDEFIKAAYDELNDCYMIEGFGYVNVCGFKD